MLFGVSGLKRTFVGISASILMIAGLLSCGSSSKTGSASGLTFRAFVSNPVYPNSTGGGSPVVEIMDASLDLLSPSVINLSSLTNTVKSAGLMAESPKKDYTLVVSPPDNKIAIIKNSTEAFSNALTLPGTTNSLFVWTDDITAFVAIPNAPVPGEPAGAVVRIDIPSATITATIPVPSVHYIVPSPNGSQILAFSDNTSTVSMIIPSLIGTGTETTPQTCSSVQVAVCMIPGTFDMPVAGVFNPSGTTAYIMNCGPECGGTGIGACLTFTSCTSIGVLDMTQNPPALNPTSIPVPAATYGLLQGNTLYVAGTPVNPADSSCSSVTPATAATTCGRLTVVDVSSPTPSSSSLAIADGYHDRMEIASNAQLFIGSSNCTNINVSGGEVRGCLTIVNASSPTIAASDVIAPPDNGDVTGITPIPNRNVVYVCQGGRLRIYLTTTDQLEQTATLPNSNGELPPNIIGQAIDVKMADF
jgi:hypothetical protein